MAVIILGMQKMWKNDLNAHKKGRGARYTRMHEPEKMVYVEEFESRGEAMKRERKIKTFSHNKKKQLINKITTRCLINRNCTIKEARSTLVMYGKDIKD